MPPRGDDSRSISTCTPQPTTDHHHLASSSSSSSSSTRTTIAPPRPAAVALALSTSSSSRPLASSLTTSTSGTQPPTSTGVFSMPLFFHRRHRQKNRSTSTRSTSTKNGVPAAETTTTITPMTPSSDCYDDTNYNDNDPIISMSNDNDSESNDKDDDGVTTNAANDNDHDKHLIQMDVDITPKPKPQSRPQAATISINEREEEGNDCSHSNFPLLEMEHDSAYTCTDDKNNHDSSLSSSSLPSSSSSSRKPLHHHNQRHCSTSSSSTSLSFSSPKKSRTIIHSTESEIATVTNDLNMNMDMGVNRALLLLTTQVPKKSIISTTSSSSSSTSSTASTASTASTTTKAKTNKTSSKTKKQRKKVQFQSIQIRTFHQILGDHPCCSTGLPLTLGWDYIQETTFHVEDYETIRDCCVGIHPRRRNRQDLRLDDLQRRSILSVSSTITSTSRDGVFTSSNSISTNTKFIGRRQQQEKSICEDISMCHHDGLLSPMEMKRAERRTYRNRERMRKRAITNRFFDSPVARTE